MDLIRVGEFELCPSERTLCAGGKPLELGARAFNLLLVLVENAGRLVTKTTLLERVWPRVIVDENNLAAQIATLRRLLGAGAIRTVPGFGYRLELQVTRCADIPDSTGGQAHSSAAPSLHASRRTWLNRLTPLIGREEELQQIEAAIDRSALVTIVGMAGVGKTRLAEEILSRRAATAQTSVAWIALGSLKEPQLIPSAIALGLGVALPDSADVSTALCEALRHLPVLLILDCAEHLSSQLAQFLATLLSHTERVRVLVTSQAPLEVAGEVVYRLGVLAAPLQGVSTEEALQSPAVSLFAQRAAAADRRFKVTDANISAIGEICRRLDGIPLALELAAARVPALGLATIRERLDDRFRLLKAGTNTPDPRHSALHAALDWSYDLLSATEQDVFNRLGTFPASFSLMAAARCLNSEIVTESEAVDLIGRLVDRSLVTALDVEPARYALLETAREFALAKLAATGLLEAARGQMAAAMLQTLDVAYQEYWSLDEAIWLDRYKPDLDNVRVAIDWAVQSDPALGVALFGSAWPLLIEADLHAEGRRRYSQVLALLSDSVPRERVARFWEAIAAYDSTRQCDRARYAAELAASMHGATSDLCSQYLSLMQFAFNWRADTAAARGAFDAARLLEKPEWPARLLTYGALTEGALLASSARYDEARAAYRRAVNLALATAERQALTATVRIVELDIACGDSDAALQLARPLALSLRHMGRLETRLELLALSFSALLLSGQIDEARTTGAELRDLALRLDSAELYTALDAMAYLACLDHRFETAARIATCADRSHSAHGQVHRRPAEQRLQNAVYQILDHELGRCWRAKWASLEENLSEWSACQLALGMVA